MNETENVIVDIFEESSVFVEFSLLQLLLPHAPLPINAAAFTTAGISSMIATTIVTAFITHIIKSSTAIAHTATAHLPPSVSSV